jgi:putative tricarboxylic transport membrane protein
MRFLVGLFILLFFALSAQAQDRKSLEIVVPAGAGGGMDSVGRAAGKVLLETHMVERIEFNNISGSDGLRGVLAMRERKGKADSLMLGSTTFVFGRLSGKVPMSQQELSPICSLIVDYQVIAVRSGSKLKGLTDLIKSVKEKPWAYPIVGGSDPGSLDHVSIAQVLLRGGVDSVGLRWIPEDAGAAALQTFVNRNGEILSGSISEILTEHKKGNIRIVAVLSPNRLAFASEVPTAKEQGLNVEFGNWRGFFAPPGISSEAAIAHERRCSELSKNAAWKAVVPQRGWVPFVKIGSDFEKFVKSEEERLAAILKELKI